MRHPQDPKAQYLDLSFGWQERGDSARLKERKRRRLRLLLCFMIGVPAVGYLLWHIV